MTEWPPQDVAKFPNRLVLIMLIGVFNHTFEHGNATSAKV